MAILREQSDEIAAPKEASSNLIASSEGPKD